MKKIFTILILFLLTGITSAQYNWVKILDSDSCGFLDFKHYKKNNQIKKDIYVLYGRPASSGTIPQDRYNSWSRLDKNSNQWYILSHNSFLHSFPVFCPWPQVNTYIYIKIIDFVFSAADTNMILQIRDIPPCGWIFPLEPAQDTRITYNNGQSTITYPDFGNGFIGNACSGFDIDPVNDSIVYFAYPAGAEWISYLWKSTNRGSNWFITDTIGQSSQGGLLRINPNRRNDIFITSGTMYKSTTGGYNFYSIGVNDFSKMEFDNSDGSIYGLTENPNAGIYKSTNNGDNWILLKLGLFHSIEINPDNHNIVYIGSDSGLYRSVNSGQSFSLYNNSFAPSRHVIGISKDPAAGDTLFVSTRKAVYKVWGENIQTIDTNALSYFPLAVGNVWVYRIDLSGTYCMRTDIRRIKVIDTINLNSKKYFLCKDTTVFFAGIPGGICPSGGSIPFDTLRIDSTNGNIYKYSYQGCSYLNHEITLDSLKAKLNDNIFINCGLDEFYTCTDTSFQVIFGQSRQVKAFNHAQDPESYWSRRYSKGIGQSQYGAPAVYGNSIATLIGCVINGILYGDTTLYYTISGHVRYQDNNQLVPSGYVKALKYDWIDDKIITVDSARFNNGNYTLTKCPQDSLDIMAYSDDEFQDFVPTYYDSTIYWQNSITLYPTANINNVNIRVHRIIQSQNNNNNFVSGGVYRALLIPNDALKDAMVYAKFNDQYISFGSSIANGYYIVDSLPAGKYDIIADRMGYYSDYKSLYVGDITLDTINFFLTRVVGSSKQISSLPTSFMLFQNYPNPFNPLTTINFNIPPMHNNPPAHPGGKGVFTKLVIYDILGREIAVIVNEMLTAGEYSVAWDASNYASGMYFYKLITDEFTETKKMVLIK